MNSYNQTPVAFYVLLEAVGSPYTVQYGRPTMPDGHTVILGCFARYYVWHARLLQKGLS